MASTGLPTNSLRNQGNASDNPAVTNSATSDGRNTAFSCIRYPKIHLFEEIGFADIGSGMP